MLNLKKILEWLIYLFIFLLPWQTVFIIQERFINGYKWQGGSLVVFATEILLWMILILQFIFLIKERKIFNFPVRNATHNVAGGQLSIFKADKGKMFFVIAIWVFLAWSLVSIAWSWDKQVAFLSWFHLLEAVALFFVLAVNKINLKNICLVAVLSGIVQSILAMWQFASQIIHANKWLGISEHLPYQIGAYVVQNSDGRWLRAYGSFAHPNILGGFLIICFFCALFLYLQHKGRIRILFLSCLLIISVGIFLSFSRGAWVALIISYIFWAVMEARKRIKEKQEIRYLFALSLALIFMIVSLAIIFQPLLLSRLSGTDRLEIKSNTQRVNSLKESWQIISSHESLGVGLGNYIPAIYAVKPNLPGWSYEPAHNVYLLVWAELGGFGLIIFLTIYALIFLHSWRKNNYLFGALVLCLGVTGLFDHYFWTQYVGLILWWLSWSFCVYLDEI